MQDKHFASPRTNRLLEHFEKLWQHPYELSFDTLKRLITDLPEGNQVLGIETLAEYLLDVMKMHFLDIVATFHQKAEEEGIDVNECAETIKDVMPESLHVLQNLGKHLSVHSVEDLATLASVTLGLYVASEVESAEQAQRWMYKLPKIYSDRLQEEHLVRHVQWTVTITATKFTASWQEVIQQPSTSWTWSYQQQNLVQNQPSTSKQRISLVA